MNQTEREAWEILMPFLGSTSPPPRATPFRSAAQVLRLDEWWDGETLTPLSIEDIERRERANEKAFAKDPSAKPGRPRKGTPRKVYTCEFLMWNRARIRARDLGRDFDIEVSDIIIPERCPILGIPLRGLGDGRPSLDRIDSRKGYIKGNVAVISFRANMLKSNGTLTEFKKLVGWLESLTHLDAMR